MKPTKRVLLVDDDPVMLEIIGLALESAGYGVQTAPDSEEALKLLSDVSRPVPDVIVTDVRMPRRGGPELLQEIGSDLRFAGVRTILMSSDATAGKNVRCDAFITKDRVACELIDTLVRLEAPQLSSVIPPAGDRFCVSPDTAAVMRPRGSRTAAMCAAQRSDGSWSES